MKISHRKFKKQIRAGWDLIIPEASTLPPMRHTPKVKEKRTAWLNVASLTLFFLLSACLVNCPRPEKSTYTGENILSGFAQIKEKMERIQ